MWITHLPQSRGIYEANMPFQNCAEHFVRPIGRIKFKQLQVVHIRSAYLSPCLAEADKKSALFLNPFVLRFPRHGENQARSISKILAAYTSRRILRTFYETARFVGDVASRISRWLLRAIFHQWQSARLSGLG